MEATAKATYVRISPRKVQIVLDLIRNQPADKALAILQYTPKAACEPVMKVLKSAIANAENNNNMDTSRLVVSYCNATAGPTLKRIRQDRRLRPSLRRRIRRRRRKLHGLRSGSGRSFQGRRCLRYLLLRGYFPLWRQHHELFGFR